MVETKDQVIGSTGRHAISAAPSSPRQSRAVPAGSGAAPWPSSAARLAGWAKAQLFVVAGSVAGRFEEEPSAPLGLIDPVFNQAGGCDITIFLADIMDLTHD